MEKSENPRRRRVTKTTPKPTSRRPAPRVCVCNAMCHCVAPHRTAHLRPRVRAPFVTSHDPSNHAHDAVYGVDVLCMYIRVYVHTGVCTVYVHTGVCTVYVHTGVRPLPIDVDATRARDTPLERPDLATPRSTAVTLRANRPFHSPPPFARRRRPRRRRAPRRARDLSTGIDAYPKVGSSAPTGFERRLTVPVPPARKGARARARCRDQRGRAKFGIWR
jgi:hypothetical protein